MPPRKKAKEYTCVICGSNFLSTSTNPPKYCSSLCRSRAAAIKYPKLEAVKKASQEKWGHDPGEYAARQREKTLEMMPKITQEEDRTYMVIPANDPEKEAELTEEEMRMSNSARETLIGMKGLITGSRMFCSDETTKDLLETLSKTVDVLLEEE